MVARCGLIAVGLLVMSGCFDTHLEVIRRAGQDAGGKDASEPDVPCVPLDLDTQRRLVNTALVITPLGPNVFGLEPTDAGLVLTSMRVTQGLLEVVERLPAQLSLVSAAWTGEAVAVGWYAAGVPNLAVFDARARLVLDPRSACEAGLGSPEFGVRVTADSSAVAIVFRNISATPGFTTALDGGFVFANPFFATGELDGVISGGRLSLVTHQPSMSSNRVELQHFSLDGGALDQPTVLLRANVVGRPFVCPGLAFSGASDSASLVALPTDGGSPAAIDQIVLRGPRLLAGECHGGGATLAYRTDPNTLRTSDVDADGTRASPIDLTGAAASTDFAVARDGPHRWLVYQSAATSTAHLLRQCVSR